MNTRYYQVCAFPDENGKYAVRVVIYNSVTGIPVAYRERSVPYKLIRALISKRPSQSYKTWPTASLTNIPHPTQPEMLTASSRLIA